MTLGVMAQLSFEFTDLEWDKVQLDIPPDQAVPKLDPLCVKEFFHADGEWRRKPVAASNPWRLMACAFCGERGGDKRSVNCGGLSRLVCHGCVVLAERIFARKEDQ